MNELLSGLLVALKAGVPVMCVGMGTVIIFLCIMICAMFAMSFAVGKLNQIFPEAVLQSAGSTKKAVASNDDAEIAAAIVASMFRK